jgi:hypothetical protein
MAIDWNKFKNNQTIKPTKIDWSKIQKNLPKPVKKEEPKKEKIKPTSFSLDLPQIGGVANSTPSIVAPRPKQSMEFPLVPEAKKSPTINQALYGDAEKKRKELTDYYKKTKSANVDGYKPDVSKMSDEQVRSDYNTKFNKQQEDRKTIATNLVTSALPTLARAPGEIASAVGKAKTAENVATKVTKPAEDIKTVEKPAKTVDPSLLSKKTTNSILNNPENKTIKHDRLTGENWSYKEAETGLALDGNNIKGRIIIGKNDDGKIILKDGTHLLEAHREKGIQIPKDKIKLEDGVTLKSLQGNPKKEIAPTFDLPADNTLKKFQRAIQDKANRLGETVDEIKKTKGSVTDDIDAYLKETLYYGRTSERIEKFNKKIVKGDTKGTSLVERMKDNGITVDELGDYLHAKHAPERNAQIAKINKDLQDGGSGLSTAEANKIIEDFGKAGKSDKLEQFSNEVYRDITQKALDIRQEAGLINAETRATLEATYKNYVPLKVDKEGTGRTMTRGFSSNKGIKRAKGSTSERINPFMQAVADYEDAVVQAEKNRVGQSFLKLAEENPNPELWEVESLQYMPRYDKNGDIVAMDARFKPADNVLSVFVDGKQKLITIKDPALASAMKNIGVEKAIPFFNQFNSYIRAVSTFYNPEFVITNFERDLQTALVHLSGEQSASIAAKTVKDIPGAMKGIWGNVRGKDGEWAKLYQEMKDAGGKAGWADIKPIDEKISVIENRIRRYNSDRTVDKLGAVLDNIGKFVSDSNEVVESAVRLSAYKNAKEAGMTVERAAELAKNLTVNFNKKGNLGVFLNSMYLFSNAGIQGSARILTTLKRSKTVRKIAVATVGASFMTAQANRAINEEAYDKIPSYEKDKNWIFMTPSGKYGKVALPYGYNILKIIGDLTDEIANKKTTKVEAFKRMVLAFDNAFNPIQSGSLGQMISPTALDPFVQQAENKSFSGNPIKKEQPQFGGKVRESSLYFPSVRKTSKDITEWLNKNTGGNELEAGKIDISPELIDHYTDFLTGGAGKFVANSLETGVSFSRGELPKTENMPFVRKLIGEPNEEYERNEMYDMLNESARKHFSDEQISDYMGYVKSAYQKKQITEEQAKRNIDNFLNSQSKIQGERLYNSVGGVKGIQGKGDFYQNLSPYEKKLFLDRIKKEYGQGL